LAQVSLKRLAGFRVADEIIAWRKLSQGCEFRPSFDKGVYLSDPQGRAIVKAPENVKAQLHIAVTCADRVSGFSGSEKRGREG
jgi:hypothetical protein